MGFWDDERGQAIQVGAVLIFGVLVILLATYQTTIVPQENKNAEFDHSLDVQQDMLDVRNAIIGAFQDGEAQPVSVKLGTTYPMHTFGVNPAPASGSLRTIDAGTITVTNETDTVSVCPVSSETKFLNYSADYNQYTPAPTLVYENTVLYADYDDGRKVIVSDQDLVRNDTINLVALQGNYSENGIGATDFQARAGLADSQIVSNPTITVPTRLSKSRWEKLVDGEANVTVSGGTAKFDFDREMTVYCSAVGADSTPPGGSRPADGGFDGGDGGDSGDGGDGTEINPSEKGTVVLESANVSTSDTDMANVVFNNTGNSPINATDARLSFHHAAGTGKSDEPADTVTMSFDSEDRADLKVGGSSESVDPPITFDQGKSPVGFTFNGEKIDLRGDYFVLKLYFDDGTSNLYFIAPETTTGK